MTALTLHLDNEVIKKMTIYEMEERIDQFFLRGNVTLTEMNVLNKQRRKIRNRLYSREARKRKREEEAVLIKENESLRQRIKILKDENYQIRMNLAFF